MSLKLLAHKESRNLNSNGKSPSVVTNPKVTKMLALSDEDFKIIIIKVFQQATANTLETNRK